MAAAALTVLASAANAADAPAVNNSPSFGSRTDKSDGSAALTIGRRLPTEWETKVGTDVSLAAPASAVPSENLLRGTAPDRSTGALWGNITMPGLHPLGFDKTAVEARVDAGTDQGKLGATLSRSVPLGDHLSLTWQNSYSVTQPLASAGPSNAPLPLGGVGPAGAIASGIEQTRALDEVLRLNIKPSGTLFSAGATSTTADDQWHNKLSVEQTVVGPLKITTSVEDAGSAASRKSITAGFKRVW